MGVRVLRTPAFAPQANSYCERLIGSTPESVWTSSSRYRKITFAEFCPNGVTTWNAVLQVGHAVAALIDELSATNDRDGGPGRVRSVDIREHAIHGAFFLVRRNDSDQRQSHVEGQHHV